MTDPATVPHGAAGHGHDEPRSTVHGALPVPHDAAGHLHDEACAMAHGELPVPAAERSLVLCFASPVARELADLAPRLGWRVALLDPGPNRAPGAAARVPDLDLDEGTDVVVCDHDRPELGDVLVELLARPARWVGVMGSLRHTAPHVAALRERGVPDDVIARVHRPIGLDVGARSPAEIAVATLAGLLADRNGRPGGLFRPA